MHFRERGPNPPLPIKNQEFYSKLKDGVTPFGYLIVHPMYERSLKEPTPHCAQCNVKLVWACIEAADDGSEVRTYECKICPEIQQYKKIQQLSDVWWSPVDVGAERRALQEM